MRRRALLLSCLVVALALPADAASYSYETWHTLALPDPNTNGRSAQVVKDVVATGPETALISNAQGLYRVVGDQAEELTMPPGIQKLATIRGAEGGEGIVWLSGGAGAMRWMDGQELSDVRSLIGIKDIAMWWRPAAGVEPAADVAVFAIFRRAFDDSSRDSVVGHSVAGGSIIETTVPDELGAPQTVAVGRQTGVRYIGTDTLVFSGPDGAAADDYADTGLHADVRTIAVHPTNEAVVYAGGPSGFYRRGTGGWSAANTSMAGIRAIAVDIAHPNHVYAANGTNVYRSTNQGVSWRSMGLVTDTAVDAISVGDNGGTLFLGSDGWGLHSYRFDRQAPTAVTMTKPSRTFATSRTVPVAWTATDAQTAVASYDIDQRTTSPAGLTSAFSPFRSATSATSASVQGQTGSTYCFRGRARDTAGNVGAYGGVECTIVPFNDTSLASAGPWKRDTGAGYYLGSFSESRTKGATLTRGNVHARQLAVVATKCPTCGSVKVLLDGVVARRIDLSAATTLKRQFLPIDPPGGVWSGTVRIVVTSDDKVVRIEGLGAGG